MLTRVTKSYSPREELPLAGYAALTLVFNTLLFALTRSQQRRGRRETINVEEMILAGIATHKLSRIISKDAVTSFLRAPFTRYQEPLGYGELSEVPRRKGSLAAISEVLNCNYCMSAWAGLGFFAGLLRFPSQTRFLTRFFSAVAISDFLHVFYEERRTHSNVLTHQEDQLASSRPSSARP